MEEKKKEKIIDAQVIEEKRKKKEKSSKKTKGIYIIVSLCVLIIAIAFVIALKNIGLLDFKTNKVNPKKVELQYTDTSKKTKEGIYITDVSDVVEEVMPSIVAITSKTLVKKDFSDLSLIKNNIKKAQVQELLSVKMNRNC